jgi:uncharacterized protein (TIGR03067 family)
MPGGELMPNAIAPCNRDAKRRAGMGESDTGNAKKVAGSYPLTKLPTVARYIPLSCINRRWQSMRWQTMIMVMATAACLTASQPPGTKSDQDALQGAWRVVGVEHDGKAKPEEFMKKYDEVWMFKGSTYNVITLGIKGSYKLDSSKKPKEIDMAGDNPPTVEKGIYELNADELKLALELDDRRPRPKEFKTMPGSEVIVLVLKRVQK